MTRDEIEAKLEAIQQLKLEIFKRIETGLTPAYDKNDATQEQPLNLPFIQQEISRLSAKICGATKGQFPVLLNIMNGAHRFSAELMENLSVRGVRYQFENIQVSSYHGTESGDLTLIYNPKVALAGRDVIVVDDICDTGKTYEKLHQKLLSLGVRSIRLVVLVDKAQERKLHPDFSAIELKPDDFVVGYGMDFDEYFRHRNDLTIVDPATLPSSREQKILKEEMALAKAYEALLIEEASISSSSTPDSADTDNSSYSSTSAVRMFPPPSSVTTVALRIPDEVIHEYEHFSDSQKANPKSAASNALR